MKRALKSQRYVVFHRFGCQCLFYIIFYRSFEYKSRSDWYTLRSRTFGWTLSFPRGPPTAATAGALHCTYCWHYSMEVVLCSGLFEPGLRRNWNLQIVDIPCRCIVCHFETFTSFILVLYINKNKKINNPGFTILTKNFLLDFVIIKNTSAALPLAVCIHNTYIILKLIYVTQ